ncbi:MAG: MFS transporter, partial [Candidatus Binataceae bacterium]
GWRLPFIAGIALAFVGFLIRRDLQAAGPQQERVSIKRLLGAHWRLIAQVGGFEVFEAIGFYSIFIYLVTYMTRVVGAPEHDALAVTTISMAFVLLVIPLAATLSDIIGRKAVLLAAAVCAALFVWPLFRLMHQRDFSSLLLAQLGLAAIIGLYEGATPAAATEAFPASARCTGVALAFNICMTLFGGTTPMVATWLIARSGSAMAPAVYMIAAAIISGAVILTLRETAKAPLKA